MANQPLYSPIKPHFFQPLLPGFTNHLDIPIAFFLKHLKESNEGKTAEFRSDASETTWKVKMDGRKLSNGWEDFAISHDLRVGDIVVFRHEGELLFHVSPLGPSCCEIQYKDSHEEDKLEKVSKKKKSLKREADSALDHPPDHSPDPPCFVATVTASNLKRDTVYFPKEFVMSNGLMKKFQIVLMNEEGESWTLDLRSEAFLRRFYMRRGWRSFCVANGKKPGDLFTLKLVQNEETPVLKLFPLIIEDLDKPDSTTDTEKVVSRKKSREIEADSSPDLSCFVATVTTSNLKRDRVYFPKTFAMSNGLMKKFQIVLMNEEGESWTLCLKHEAFRFHMRGGWRSFCVANGKKPGDSFTFKLVSNEETPMLQLFPLDSEDLHKHEPSNDIRERKCLEAIGVEANHNDSRHGKCLQAIKEEYVSTEENSSTRQNRFVTLTLTPASKLTLPLDFSKRNGISTAGKITMLDRYGARWSTPILKDKHKDGTMSLGRGSKGFCEVNGVKMNGSFVLEVIWEDTVPLLKFYSKV